MPSLYHACGLTRAPTVVWGFFVGQGSLKGRKIQVVCYSSSNIEAGDPVF